MARLQALDRATLAALADADLALAAQRARVALEPDLVDELWLWRLRLEQLTHTPDDLPWLARLVVVDHVAVGHAGFHSSPDDDGLVELGYWVAPARRGEGLGGASLALLTTWGHQEPRLRTLRACVAPANEVSTHLVRAAGYTPGGLLDGERVWELDVSG